MAGAVTGILELSYGASGVVTANRFATLTGNQTVLRSGANEDALGVAKADISTAEATAGKLTDVQVLGVAWVEAGAAVTRGDLIMTDSSGRGITATGTNVVVGKALTGASGAGVLFLCLLSALHFKNGS